MKAPCDNCPFVIGGSFTISGLTRAKEIAGILASDGQFTCHKTTHETGTGKPEHCYGAMKVLMAEDRPNQMMRILGRLGMISEKQIANEPTPCFETLDEWVEVMQRGT